MMKVLMPNTTKYNTKIIPKTDVVITKTISNIDKATFVLCQILTDVFIKLYVIYH